MDSTEELQRFEAHLEEYLQHERDDRYESDYEKAV